MEWVIEQTWKHVLFLHWRIPSELLRDLVPFDLDLFEGEAIISIVPFRMEAIRFPYTPSVPFFSKLWELNLRTYVKVHGQHGIYFLTLDTDSRLGQWIAKNIFYLPYRVAKMEAGFSENIFRFKSVYEKYEFKLHARVGTVAKSKTPLAIWATERYDLFLVHGDRVYRGRVRHDLWSLMPVEMVKIENSFSDQFGISLIHGCAEANYCPELKVRFEPFEQIERLRPL